MTKVYKLTVSVIDHDDIGLGEVINVIESQKYPNWCISPRVVESWQKEIDYHDDHPLNRGNEEVFRASFNKFWSGK